MVLTNSAAVVSLATCITIGYLSRMISTLYIKQTIKALVPNTIGSTKLI